MSVLKVPVTASSMPEWVRRAATAINDLITRQRALEEFAAAPFVVDSVRLRPVALPSSPEEGTTVYDMADKKVKTWDGTTWQAHY